MRRTAVLFLAIGFAAGLAVGLALRGPAGSVSHAPPRDVVEVVTVLPVPAAEAPTVPAESETLEEGVGWIEVLGSDAVDVYGWDFRGERECAEEDDAAARWELVAGEYEVVWHDGGVECCVRARVRPGATTVVDTTKPAPPYRERIAHGLGRLEVALFDVVGRPLGPASVALIGRGLDGREVEDAFSIGKGGAGAADLRPGSYRLRAGAYVLPVEVRDGEVTSVELRPGGEGEVVVPELMDGSHRFQLRLPGTAEPDAGLALAVRDGWRPRLLFVAPGTYRGCMFLSREERWRDLGPVQVRRGGITEIDLPPGKINVSIRNGGKRTPPSLKLLAVTPDIHPRSVRIRLDAGSEGRTGAWVLYLEAGTYRIEIDSEGFLPVRREVEVGEDVAWVAIDLQRAG